MPIRNRTLNGGRAKNDVDWEMGLCRFGIVPICKWDTTRAVDDHRSGPPASHNSRLGGRRKVIKISRRKVESPGVVPMLIPMSIEAEAD